MKPKFLVCSFTGCSGCISELISLDIFPQFLERIEFQYFPFISDRKDIESCDMALIEGCISEELQINKLKKIRKNAKKVYAFGSCATFGGILNLSNEKKAIPISNFIEIDGIIPGCPPPSNLLGNILIRLIERKEINLPERSMCASCPLRTDTEFDFNTEIEKLFPESEQIFVPEENMECFLKRGILCLGPIIRDGCEHICIKEGIPCEGCMGPISKDFTSTVVNFLSLFNLAKNLRNYKGIFYRFSKPNIKR